MIYVKFQILLVKCIQHSWIIVIIIFFMKEYWVLLSKHLDVKSPNDAIDDLLYKKFLSTSMDQKLNSGEGYIQGFEAL